MSTAQGIGSGAPVRSGPLPALDALRAVAAVAVVFAHLYTVFAFRGTLITWARAGDVGVYVFFVLSGYLIAASVLAPVHFDRRGYMLRRATRILPLYYATIVVSVLFIDATPLTTAHGRLDIAAHLLLIHNLWRDFRYSINGVFWTLSVEWLFYLLMVALAPLLRRPRIGWVTCGAMIGTGLVWRTWRTAAPHPTTSSTGSSSCPARLTCSAPGCSWRWRRAPGGSPACSPPGASAPPCWRPRRR